MLDKREVKIRNLIRKRQIHFSVILENVTDPHNIGAVMRTCDAVGITEIFLINTLDAEKNMVLGKRASSGARKWVDVYEFVDLKVAFDFIKNKGYEDIWATRIVENSKSLYEIDFTQKIALLFGNEHKGLSDEASSYATGNFVIPQVGMVQSLNISVACAVSLYEGYRQRSVAGMYDHPALSESEQELIFKKYADRELIRFKGRSTIRVKD